ncbi:SGNH/GDSL hydrolase family protein [Alicyclobacillus dauci]|uniref:SGNH/GDSL hydrolase family protein n=1 Tax=Alicyclobacillus dauci TaxID=1475485 RepID=A0ABY6Z3G5_9BACL|nr:SGNH/GDSL hydrolase family protein [Alicyclobacillus dauci]WAH37429.1 SGNH/GDSL hydrolase family protein [Alicyclobacillus dauci]
MLMLALGDSITYGYGATSPEQSYVRLLTQQFARSGRVSLHVQAKPGWTARQLNKSLEELPECVFDEAQIVTLMVGGNDLLRAAPSLIQGKPDKIAQVCERSRQDIEQIVSRANRPYNSFAIATLYNPFPNFDMAERIVTQWNDMIRTVAARHKLLLMDASKIFRGHESDYVEHYKNGLFRDIRFFRNPIHPTDPGHEALYQGFYATLQKARSNRQKRRVTRQRRRA